MSTNQAARDIDQCIFIAGHHGMVGSAIVRRLQRLGYHNFVVRTHAELDFTQQTLLHELFQREKIDQVYLAAAKVGGIHANNTYPADFIYDNLLIQCNIIHAAHMAGIRRLMFLGSSCIYPRLASQPMKEDALLSGALEPTNEPYAIAKIAGIKLCESYNRQFGHDYRSVMPTNLYGPHDNFHPENSHVIPAMMLRFRDAIASGASEVVIWGSGAPMREFLHVDDMAAATVQIMELDSASWQALTRPMVSHINVGSGIDCTIAELAQTMARVTGFQGRLVFDTGKPDGMPRKLMDISLLKSLGWVQQISLEQGLRDTWQWFLQHSGPHRSR